MKSESADFVGFAVSEMEFAESVVFADFVDFAEVVTGELADFVDFAEVVTGELADFVESVEVATGELAESGDFAATVIAEDAGYACYCVCALLRYGPIISLRREPVGRQPAQC